MIFSIGPLQFGKPYLNNYNTYLYVYNLPTDSMLLSRSTVAARLLAQNKAKTKNTFILSKYKFTFNKQCIRFHLYTNVSNQSINYLSLVIPTDNKDI